MPHRRFACAIALALFAGFAAAQDPATDKTDKTALAALTKKAESAFQAQKWDEAVAAYRELVKVDEKNPLAWHHLGYSLHAAGKLDEALAIHLKAAEFPRMRSTALYNAACVHALKKEKDKAFEMLQKCVEAGFAQVDTLDTDSDMDSVRDDARFAKIVEGAKANAAKGGEIAAFAHPSARGATRMVWFGNGGGKGTLAITYGKPKWKAEYDKQIDSPRMKGRRWRLGHDHWTTLDASVDATIGTAKVAPGDYYLAVERNDAGDYLLVILNAGEVRAKRLDAFQVEATKGMGTTTPLKHETVSEVAETLSIELSFDDDSKTSGQLVIHFGGHKLTAPVTVAMKS